MLFKPLTAFLDYIRTDSDKSRLPAGEEEKGNAIVEFAIVLPMIFMLFVGTVEFTRIFRVKEMMSLGTREAAHLAFRECFDTRRAVCNLGGDEKISVCLNLYAASITETIQRKLPEINLTLSMYVFDATDPLDPTLGDVDLLGFTFDPDVGTPGNRSLDPAYHRFSVPIVEARYRDIIQKQQVLVFAEIFYEFPYWFETDFLPDLEMYDVTVF